MQVIAHRGNSSAAPENTFAAFESAIAGGVTLVECDVQMTADGEVVIIHDTSIERTSGVAGDVRSMTLRDLRAIDVRYPARFGDTFPVQRIPTLAELLEFLKGRARVLLEIKKESSDPGDDRFERKIAAAVESAGLTLSPGNDTEAALLSFDTRALSRMAALLPEAPRGHLFYRDSEEAMFAGASAARASFVMPEKGALSPGLAERVEARGLGLATWVCDSPDEIDVLASYGLLGFGTNRPLEMLAALKARRARLSGR